MTRGRLDRTLRRLRRPAKALLNNLLPRLEQYTAWLGRRVALWHGDIGDSARRAIPQRAARHLAHHTGISRGDARLAPRRPPAPTPRAARDGR